MNKTLVVSPTYNEKKNIRELVTRILEVKADIDILIIDDNSPDGTAEIIKEMQNNNSNIYLLERGGKFGLGTAYCLGFKWALENDYEYIIQMDADLSHNPSDIPSLLQNIKKYDLVIGSRYIQGVNVINWPMRRLILSYCANIYAKVITGIPVKDATGGFKCFRRKVLKELQLDSIKSQGYSFQIEMNFLVWINGFSIKEIPIVFFDRTVGESKMNRSIILEAIWVVPKLKIKKLLRLI